MTPVVRAAEARDAAALSELLGQLGYANTPGEVRERLAALAASAADAVLVAVVEGNAVGLATIHLIPLLQEARPIARITAFVVAESARRQGIGRLLLEASEAHALSRGAGRLELTSSDRRLGAHQFYLSCGFAREAQRFVKHLDATHCAPKF